MTGSCSTILLAMVQIIFLRLLHNLVQPGNCGDDCWLADEARLLATEERQSCNDWEIAKIPSGQFESDFEEQIDWYDEDGWDEYGFGQEGNDRVGNFQREVDTRWLGPGSLKVLYGVSRRKYHICGLDETQFLCTTRGAMSA